MNNDLISRSELKSVLENECFWCANQSEPCDKPCWHCINEKIENATPVEPEITEKQAILLLINSGWLVNHDKELREKWERPQVELANEVWELYEKYQPHLATRVLEFGDDLKELLGKYQEGGKEE